MPPASTVPLRPPQVARPPQLAELGTDLLRLSRFQLIRTLSWPFISCLAYWCFASAQWDALAVGSLVVLSFVTFGSTSHDLVHGNLGLSQRWNDVLLSVIELLALRSGHAYQAAHLNHHARFPHDDDVESKAAGTSLMRALGEGFVFQFRIYVWALTHAPAKRLWILMEGLAIIACLLAAILAWRRSHRPRTSY